MQRMSEIDVHLRFESEHDRERSVPDGAELDNLQAVKQANPAPWITLPDLRRQRAAIPETALAQFHACRWGIGEGSWLPPGAWQACVGEAQFKAGEDFWIGVDYHTLRELGKEALAPA
jgi:hypothetical protein